MRVIDCHTHTFPAKIAASALTTLSGNSHTRPFTDGTAEGLGQAIARAGVDLAVILPVATSPRQVVKVNDASLAINARTAETGLLSFGCMHPDFPDWHGELGRIAAAGIRGVKLHPVYQQTPIDDPRCVRIMARCAELGLAVTIHAGIDIGFPGHDEASPERLDRAIRAAGHGTYILAHMGGWRQWEQAADLLCGRGLYIDTAFSLGRLSPNGDGFPWDEASLEMMTPEDFLAQVEAFGADHVLFGTDSPWAEEAQAVADFLALPLREEAREMILHRNAEALLGLSPES
ncbi:MAG: amidohydrolase family protein [Clostridia bacterium]|nr:amidohydrolase family protein [Clostridia bacterium]